MKQRPCGAAQPPVATSIPPSPGYRSRIPNAAQLSEFYGSGRQSRLAIKFTGKIPSMTMTGYYEMDWLGTGITSNNNQSNSYVAAPEAAVGAGCSEQRLEVYRRSDVVAGNRNDEGSG